MAKVVSEKVAIENHGNVVSTSAVDHSEEVEADNNNVASDVVHVVVKTVVME